MSSCASTIKPSRTPEELYRKICVEGSGKGRIEFLQHKFVFSYESGFDLKKNLFNLVLDFPVIGERFLNFSLDPRVVRKAANSSEITEMLKKNIGERKDSAEISKAIEEFFINSSEFMRFKAINKFPTHFAATSSGENFILQKSSDQFIYSVESSVLNEKFFERLQFKIYSQSKSSVPIMTLFLIPQSCD